MLERERERENIFSNDIWIKIKHVYSCKWGSTYNNIQYYNDRGY